MHPFEIRPAIAGDEVHILRLIQALADYEKLSHEVIATEAALRETLFGSKRVAECQLAQINGKVVGFALYFYNYSTFLAKPGIYLEDLFVEPEYRGQGIGKALIESVFIKANKEGCGRVEWSVLNWNEPPIQFYKSLGAKPMDEWTVYRLTGEELAKYA